MLKPETKFGLYAALLIVTAFVFNILFFDYNIGNARTPIGYYFREHFDRIQFLCGIKLFIVAGITTGITLVNLKKRKDLWSLATKVMWLSFILLELIYFFGERVLYIF